MLFSKIIEASSTAPLFWDLIRITFSICISINSLFKEIWSLSSTSNFSQLLPITQYQNHLSVFTCMLWKHLTSWCQNLYQFPRAAIQIGTDWMAKDKRNVIFFITVLETRRPKSKCHKDQTHSQGSREESFLACLLASSGFWQFSLFPHMNFFLPCVASYGL